MITTVNYKKMAILKEHFCLICTHLKDNKINTNHCAAILLNYFEQWNEFKIKNSKDNIQFHTVDEIHDDLLTLYSHKTIREALEYLHDLGFVLNVKPSERPKNCHPRSQFFIFNAEYIESKVVNLPIQNGNFTILETEKENFKMVKLPLYNGNFTIIKRQNYHYKTVILPNEPVSTYRDIESPINPNESPMNTFAKNEFFAQPPTENSPQVESINSNVQNLHNPTRANFAQVQTEPENATTQENLIVQISAETQPQSNETGEVVYLDDATIECDTIKTNGQKVVSRKSRHTANPTLTQQFREKYLAWYKEQTGNAYYWEVKHATILNTLINKLKLTAKEWRESKFWEGEYRPENDSFTIFGRILKDYAQIDDKTKNFVNFDILKINSNYNDILNCLKNGKPKTTSIYGKPLTHSGFTSKEEYDQFVGNAAREFAENFVRN